MQDLIGEYNFISKHFGKIPFIVYDIDRFNNEYPLNVRTVEYKGRKRIPVDTNYREDVVRQFIADGKLVKQSLP